jgi:hypothetical protein
MPRGGNREGAGRKAGWKNSETQVIRVPKNLVAHILEYAKKIDSGELERLSFVKPVGINERVDEVEIQELNLDEVSIFSSVPVINESVTESIIRLDSVTDSLMTGLESVTDSSNSILEFVIEPLSLPLESVTDSSDLFLDSVTDSKASPIKPDCKRWLSSEQAWNIARERGCDRSLAGFRSWSKRNPDECSIFFSLRRLESLRGRTSAPAFEDLRHNQDSDCQDF